jgi:hypothetical protein
VCFVQYFSNKKSLAYPKYSKNSAILTKGGGV